MKIGMLYSIINIIIIGLGGRRTIWSVGCRSVALWISLCLTGGTLAKKAGHKCLNSINQLFSNVFFITPLDKCADVVIKTMPYYENHKP